MLNLCDIPLLQKLQMNEGEIWTNFRINRESLTKWTTCKDDKCVEHNFNESNLMLRLKTKRIRKNKEIFRTKKRKHREQLHREALEYHQMMKEKYKSPSITIKLLSLDYLREKKQLYISKKMFIHVKLQNPLMNDLEITPCFIFMNTCKLYIWNIYLCQYGDECIMNVQNVMKTRSALSEFMLHCWNLSMPKYIDWSDECTLNERLSIEIDEGMQDSLLITFLFNFSLWTIVCEQQLEHYFDNALLYRKFPIYNLECVEKYFIQKWTKDKLNITNEALMQQCFNFINDS